MHLFLYKVHHISLVSHFTFIKIHSLHSNFLPLLYLLIPQIHVSNFKSFITLPASTHLPWDIYILTLEIIWLSCRRSMTSTYSICVEIFSFSLSVSLFPSHLRRQQKHASLYFCFSGVVLHSPPPHIQIPQQMHINNRFISKFAISSVISPDHFHCSRSVLFRYCFYLHILVISKHNLQMKLD